MPELASDGYEGPDGQSLPPPKKPKIHHEYEADGSVSSGFSKPGNSRHNPLDLNHAHPASSPSVSKVKMDPTTPRTTKPQETPTTRHSSKRNILNGPIKAYNNLTKSSSRVADSNLLSSPTPGRIPGSTAPTRPADYHTITTMGRPRGQTGQLRQQPARSAATRNGASQAPMNIDADESADELAAIMPTHYSKNGLRRKQPKAEKLKAGEEHGQTMHIFEEIKGSDKNRADPFSGLVGIPAADDAPHHRRKVKDRMRDNEQDVHFRQAPPEKIELDDSESEAGEDIKSTNFDSFSARNTRGGGQKPKMEKPFDFTNKSKRKKTTASWVQIKAFSWAGRPDLDYWSSENENENEHKYIFVKELKDEESGKSLPGEIYIFTKEEKEHIRFPLAAMGIVAYDFENGELIFNQNKGPRDLDRETKQWILIKFHSENDLKQFQNHLSPNLINGVDHLIENEQFKKQKDYWRSWYEKFHLRPKIIEKGGHNDELTDTTKNDCNEMDPGTKHTIDKLAGTTRGLLCSQRRHETQFPAHNKNFLGTGVRLGDGRRVGESRKQGEVDLEYKDPTTVARATRSAGTAQFEALPPPRRSARTTAPKPTVPKLKLPAKVWEEPLVFPKTGRDRAIVEYDDLTRLNEGEFLNDNLINFYLKWTEDQLRESNPDLAKRTHFFNTFFYERLKRKDDGKRDFSAMKNWTKNVDLFEKDFVFVPINEFSHWYLAIICNLSQLPRQLENMEKLTMDAANEQPLLLNSHPLSPPEAPPMTEESPGEPMEGVEMETKGSNCPTSPSNNTMIPQPPLFQATVDAMDLDDHDQGLEIPDSQPTQSFSSLSQNPQIENLLNGLIPHANQEKLAMDDLVASANSSPRTKMHADQPEPPRFVGEAVVEDANMGSKRSPVIDGQPGKGSQLCSTVIDLDAEAKQVAAIKEQTSGPVIFILDSLGSGPNQHNPTIQNLRRYLQNEASSRRTIQINDLTNAIQGGYADVPEQPNHCDCGVYLLHYVETFLEDPDFFLEQFWKRKLANKAKKRIPRELARWNESRIVGMRKEIMDLICDTKDRLDGNSPQPREDRPDKAKLKKTDTVKPLDVPLKDTTSSDTRIASNPTSLSDAQQSKTASRQPSPDSESDVEILSETNRTTKLGTKKEKAKAKPVKAAAAPRKGPAKDDGPPHSPKPTPLKPTALQEAHSVTIVPRQTRSAKSAPVLSPDFQLKETQLTVGPDLKKEIMQMKEPKKSSKVVFGPGNRGKKTPESSDTEQEVPQKETTKRTSAQAVQSNQKQNPPSPAKPVAVPVIGHSQNLAPAQEEGQKTPPAVQVTQTPQETPSKTRHSQSDPTTPNKRRAAQPEVQVPSSSSPARIQSTQENECTPPTPHLRLFRKEINHAAIGTIDLTGHEKKRLITVSASPEPEPERILNSSAPEAKTPPTTTHADDDNDEEMIDVESTYHSDEGNGSHSSTGSDGDDREITRPPNQGTMEIYAGGREVKRKDGTVEIHPPPRQKHKPLNCSDVAREGLREIGGDLDQHKKNTTRGDTSRTTQERSREKRISSCPPEDKVPKEEHLQRGSSKTQWQAVGMSARNSNEEYKKPVHTKFEYSSSQDGEFKFKRVNQSKQIQDPKQKDSPDYRTSRHNLRDKRERSGSVVEAIQPDADSPPKHSDWKDLDKYSDSVAESGKFPELPTPVRPIASERAAKPIHKQQHTQETRVPESPSVARSAKASNPLISAQQHLAFQRQGAQHRQEQSSQPNTRRPAPLPQSQPHKQQPPPQPQGVSPRRAPVAPVAPTTPSAPITRTNHSSFWTRIEQENEEQQGQNKDNAIEILDSQEEQSTKSSSQASSAGSSSSQSHPTKRTLHHVEIQAKKAPVAKLAD